MKELLHLAGAVTTGCGVPVHVADDYPVQAGTAAIWLQRPTGPTSIVTVTAYVVSGVPSTPALLAELNTVSGHSPLTQLLWAGGSVICRAAVPESAVDVAAVSVLCTAVAAEATRLGPLLSAMFGGASPFSYRDVHVS